MSEPSSGSDLDPEDRDVDAPELEDLAAEERAATEAGIRRVEETGP